MNIPDSDIPTFVPEESKMAVANDILKDILKEGYTIRQRTARGRKKATTSGMVKALAHRLSDINEVKSVTKRSGKKVRRFYFREV